MIVKKAQSLGLSTSINDFDVETINILYEIDTIAKEQGSSNGRERGNHLRPPNGKR